MKIPPALLALLLSLLPCGLTGCWRGEGQVAVLNQTGRAITEGELRIGPQIFPIARIEPGGSQAFSFQSSLCRSCPYQISLTLSDHSQAVDAIGGVRRGTDYQDRLVVERKSLSLESLQNASGDRKHFSKGTQSKQLKWIRVK